ncbi:hypothetical protein F5Y00DRAFT_269463 [Daldinia vernicosa]|uniref:uncharacterized protein n=1 Tax=Daldinia vernicosa TaxID=114800 RepID=UPI0020072C69|nr:uncharacterized protein F5Y00DRAFT_269463 [Daldinia vernicosa]KAI0849464.1 hypothetical protein F5Y00DRAFT_269463 [Daldinia vernicosa]
MFSNQQHRVLDQPFTMNQQVSESMGQATHHSAGNKTDTDPNIEGAWILRQPWHPNLPFDRLQIGGSAQLPNYSKQQLKAFVKDVEAEEPMQYEEEIDDNAIIKFVARPHVEAIRYAVHATAVQPPSSPPRLVMFTDGSLKSTYNIGCGITYKRTYVADRDWIDAAYGSKGISKGLEHEVTALHRGLWIAYYEMMDWAGRVPNPRNGGRATPPTVIIITDGLSGIQRLHYSYCYTKVEPKPRDEGLIHQYLVYPLEKLVNLGSKVEIHWTPGHVGIEGNSRADSLASIGADYAIKYSRSTGRGIINLMLPFSNQLSGQKAREAYPFHLGNPMNDLIHWRKEETRMALRFVLNSGGSTNFLAWLAKAGISRNMSKTTQMVIKKKQVTKAMETKMKAAKLLRKAGKLFEEVFPPKDNRDGGTRQSKRRAHDEADVDDLDDLIPQPKRVKADDPDDVDPNCIMQGL